MLEWLHDHPIATPTLAVLPEEAGPPLLRIVSESVDDFIVSPIRGAELRSRLDRVLGARHAEVAAVRQRLLEEIGLAQFVGSDSQFVKAIEQLPRFARSDVPVLITGETGTGKELCARAIHHLGRRQAGPFIAVDCGALPEHLFENELFGHNRGAFTDAHRDQRGLVAMADGGTLFLDEIDALSLTAQGKLLRFLQEHTFRPLGADRFQRADVNVIAATNRDLEACIRDRQFRADLYFRLNVLRLHLPPLRARRGDIALLANHFVETRRAATAAGPRALSAAAIRALSLYDWPGNVRELANVVQRAIVVCDGDRILPSHVSLPQGASSQATPGYFRAARAAAVEAFERQYVEDLLRKHGGNVTQAARAAHKERRSFGRLLKKYRIVRHPDARGSQATR
jgi:DNA-binding NtrC family response regulator